MEGLSYGIMVGGLLIEAQSSRQAEHPIWLILMTICEKSGATVKILPLTYMYERSFQAKFQGHSDGGEHLPHDLRLKPE